ncbi:MAG: carboxymuconolactone decarboxylase family protein [Phenylobacterium sp.]|nr:carboxymuconolactone decarboxylase family protein [Phenylobacterium sp.]
MSRVKLVSRGEVSPDLVHLYDQVFGPDRDPVETPGTVTGTPGNWWTAWANVPGILKAFSAFPMADATLDPKLRELAILRTGYARASLFVFSQHCKAARRVGLEEAKIEAVPYWTLADCYSGLERAVLAFVDGQILEGGRVHDKVVEHLRAGLSDEHLLMLTYFINMYALHATSTKALRLEYDDVAERVAEIPVPETPGVQDWRRAGG